MTSPETVVISELSSEDRLYPRLKNLKEFYSSQYGSDPEFLVRMPGRVNIIGEHVDYCGYPVLPMAIDQSIVIAVRRTNENSFFEIRNTESAKFENFKCDLKEIKISVPETGGPPWYNYYLCGIKGIYDQLGDKLKHIGMSVVMNGNVPIAAGLSSSSAFVSAAVLATAYIHQFPLDRKNLASISANCERYIGTQGGGMDQAIAYLARQGCAQFIEFHPELKATPVVLPKGACFVVANSLVKKFKAGSSDFNERVVECRLGSRLIAKRKELSNWRELTKFADLQTALKCDLAQLEEHADQLLPKDIYTRSELCADLAVSEQEFENDFLTPNTRHMAKFKLRQRALHVIQESLRVRKFRSICNTENSAAAGIKGGSPCCECHDEQEPLPALADLMRQSHRSLKELYECSHPDLDRIIELSDAQGVGARLTGAGWGGCVVALCNSLEASSKYIQELKDKYYSKLSTHIQEKHQHNDYADVIFATLPGDGAGLFSMR